MNLNDVKLFSAGIEVAFPKPIPWTPTLLAESATKLAEAVGFPLRSDQFRVRHNDVLFGYEMAATFFGGSAVFARSPDKLTLHLQNARRPEERKVVLDIVERFGRLFLEGTALKFQITVNAHVDIGSQEKRHEYLRRFFSPSDKIDFSGGVGYLMTELTEESGDPIRIMIEPSFSFPEALFVSWMVSLISPNQWVEELKSILECLQETAKLYDLNVALMPTA